MDTLNTRIEVSSFEVMDHEVWYAFKHVPLNKLFFWGTFVPNESLETFHISFKYACYKCDKDSFQTVGGEKF